MRILNPQWEWLDVTDDVWSILWDFNYAVNFYLYVITGRVVTQDGSHVISVAEGTASPESVCTQVCTVFKWPAKPSSQNHKEEGKQEQNG